LGGAETQTKKGANGASLYQIMSNCLEIAAAFRVATVAIYFDRFARTFTRCAAVLATRLWWTSAWRVLALILFVIVCHRNFLLVNRRFLGHNKSLFYSLFFLFGEEFPEIQY
jgi:hypothetical protein